MLGVFFKLKMCSPVLYSFTLHDEDTTQFGPEMVLGVEAGIQMDQEPGGV